MGGFKLNFANSQRRLYYYILFHPVASNLELLATAKEDESKGKSLIKNERSFKSAEPSSSFLSRLVFRKKLQARPIQTR